MVDSLSLGFVECEVAKSVLKCYTYHIKHYFQKQ